MSEGDSWLILNRLLEILERRHVISEDTLKWIMEGDKPGD